MVLLHKVMMLYLSLTEVQKKGNTSLTSNYGGGGQFQFSSELNKTKFEGSPEAFAPQYGGYCAIAMSEDKEVIPNPKSWELRDG